MTTESGHLEVECSIWPAEGQWAPVVYQVMRHLPRISQDFADRAEWNVWRDCVEAAGLTVREIEMREVRNVPATP